MTPSKVLRQARRLVEEDGETPDGAMWVASEEDDVLFYRAKDYVERAGDFRTAIAEAEEDESAL